MGCMIWSMAIGWFVIFAFRIAIPIIIIAVIVSLLTANSRKRYSREAYHKPSYDDSTLDKSEIEIYAYISDMMTSKYNVKHSFTMQTRIADLITESQWLFLVEDISYKYDFLQQEIIEGLKGNYHQVTLKELTKLVSLNKFYSKH